MDNFTSAEKSGLSRSDGNEILTQSGAVDYRSTGNSLVDFSYAAASLRSKSSNEIMEMFERCYIDNPMLATKLMFQIGDVRKGKGERRTFNACLNYMALAHPEICKALMPLVAEYTRWDHVAELAVSDNPTVAKCARKLMAEQLRKDYDVVQLIEKDNERRATLEQQMTKAKTAEEAKQIADAIAKIPHRQLTLCAKWAPSLGAKKSNMLADKGAPKRNPEKKVGDHHRVALKIAETIFKNDPKAKEKYRKMRASINRHLGVMEVDLSAGRIEDISFGRMTSAQQAKYSEQFKAAGEAYRETPDNLDAGEVKMNTAVLTPANVVHKYTDSGRYIKPFEQATELLWKNLQQVERSAGVSCIAVLDGSDSMLVNVSYKTSMTALEVATALSLYCAEHLPGAFRDKFISFSKHPKLLDVSPFDTLHDRLEYAFAQSEASNIDVKAVFDLLLNTAIDCNMSQAEIPGTVLMMSDMEFDARTSMYNLGDERYSYDGIPDKALFEEIRQAWEDAGFKMPTLAFWNLNAARNAVPIIDDRGVVLLFGFSTRNQDMIMNGGLADFTPAKHLELVLGNARYNAVEEAFEAGLAAERASAHPNNR